MLDDDAVILAKLPNIAVEQLQGGAKSVAVLVGLATIQRQSGSKSEKERSGRVNFSPDTPHILKSMPKPARRTQTPGPLSPRLSYLRPDLVGGMSEMSSTMTAREHSGMIL